jgi:hypothetical protein
VITDVAGNAFGGIAQNDLDFTVAAPQNYRLQLLHFSDGSQSAGDQPRTWRPWWTP